MNVSRIVREVAKEVGVEIADCIDKCGERTVVVPVVVVVVTGNKTIVDREWCKSDDECEEAEQLCSCGKPGVPRKHHGSPCGTHCDTCWVNLLTDYGKQ